MCSFMSAGLKSSIEALLNFTVHCHGVYSPVNNLRIVDFHAPDGPTNAIVSHGETSKEIF